MFNRLSKIRSRISSNKDGKVLVQNFAYLSLLQVAGYVFPLITMPYLARVIGVEGFGKIAFAAGVMVWLQTISDWGFNFTATRDVAQNRENTEKVSEIFSRVLCARIVLMLASAIILFILVTFIPLFKRNADVLFVSFLMIPGHILYPEWFFQAMERMKYITILSLLSKLVFTIAIFIFVKEKDDYILQPLFTSLGFVVSGCIALYFILIKWKVKLIIPTISSVFHTIKRSTDVFLNSLMPNLYNSFSTVLLGFFGGEVANGKLDAGTRLVNIAMQFTQVLSRTFFPFLSRRLDKHNLYVRINLTVSLCISITLFLLAPIIINIFFTKEFIDAVLVLRITAFSIFFIALNNVYGTNYLIIAGYERQLRNTTAVVSVIGFIMAFPLIYFWGFIGAAITIALTRAMLGTSIMIKALKIKQKNEQNNTNH